MLPVDFFSVIETNFPRFIEIRKKDEFNWFAQKNWSNRVCLHATGLLAASRRQVPRVFRHVAQSIEGLCERWVSTNSIQSLSIFRSVDFLIENSPRYTMRTHLINSLGCVYNSKLNEWQRAKILNIHDDGTLDVFYIDVGAKELRIPKSNFKNLKVGVLRLEVWIRIWFHTKASMFSRIVTRV